MEWHDKSLGVGLDSALVHASVVQVVCNQFSCAAAAAAFAAFADRPDPTDYVLCLSKLANENAARQTEWERERERGREEREKSFKMR